MTQPLGQLEKILLPTDGSEFSAGAEREAINLARRLGSYLYITSVVHGFPEEDALAFQQLIEREQEKANSYMEAVKSKAVEAGVKCEKILRNGEAPYQEIVDTAEEQQVDLIVMGRRGKKNMMRLLVGASTAEVIGSAHCSVLVTPREAKFEGKNLLLAVDGSPYSDRATTAAMNLAKRLKVPITLLSVVYSEHKESRRRDAETVVERTKKLLEAEGISVESRIVTGRYAESIVETAQNVGCDLIVVGSHGRTGLKKLLLGSVSERVIGLAPCAVLVVKNN
jgi:nucleotide-binding universal stress UspA family protein